MKKIILGIVVIIMMASIINFVSCSKEKETDVAQSVKSSYVQIERIGEIHNETLWDLGVDFQEDLQSIVANKGITEADLLELQARMENWGRERCSSLMGNEYSCIFDDWHLDMEEVAIGFMTDSMLNNLLDQATSLEHLIEVIEDNEEEISSNMKSIEDTTQLMSLILLRHSIQFWTDAYYDPANPWHEMICCMPLYTDTKGLPDLWKKTKTWVKDKLVPIVKDAIEVVVAVVSFALSDAWVFGKTYPGFTVAMGPTIGAVPAAVMSAVGSAVGGAMGYIGTWSILGK